MDSVDGRKRRHSAVAVPPGGGAAGGAESLTEMKALLRQTLSRLNSVETELSKMKGEIDVLKTKNKNLENKLSSIVGEHYELYWSVRTLSDHTEWRYTSCVPSQWHWQQQGFDAEYIGNINEYFFDVIKELTQSMRRGQFNNDITLRNCEDPETILHDDTMIPHWQELVDALRPWHKIGDSQLEISVNNMQLPSEVLELLTPVLSHKRIGSLKLFGCDFTTTREGVDLVVNMLQQNRFMSSFEWSYCELVTSDSLRIFNAIEFHPSLLSIELDSYLGDDENGYDNLVLLLTTKPKLQTVSYRYNNVHTAGDTRLYDYLATNPTLSLLYLDDNDLNDADAGRIASMLQQNTNLNRFDLSDNSFTESGGAALGRSIRDETTLASLSACNHTCDLSFNCQLVSWRSYDGRNAGRPKKIYDLLSKRNRKEINVDCLKKEIGGDELFRLVPNILALVHRYYFRATQNEFPLSIIYEILRKMPEVTNMPRRRNRCIEASTGN